MSAAATPVSATDLARRAADKPCLVARNTLELVAAAADLVTNTAGDLATADISASQLYDRTRMIDRWRQSFWKANAAGAGPFYVVADLGAGAPAFGCLILDGGHNLDGATIVAEADDAGAPTVGAWAGATTILGATVLAGDGPAVFLFADTYAPRYFRLKITPPGSITPQIPQLWLGNVVQFPVKSEKGSVPAEAFASAGVDHETESGIVWTHGTSPARAKRHQEFTIPEATDGTFMTALADALKNADAANGPRRAFWWIENPNSAPNSALFVKSTDKEFLVVEDKEGAGFTSKWTLNYREQGGALF